MPLTGKYLKYSPEITLEIFTLVWNKLKSIYEVSYNDTTLKRFDEFKRGEVVRLNPSERLGIYSIDPNATETTVQEILGYDPFVKDDFVLPKSWYVVVNEENLDILSKWRFNDSENKLRTGQVVGISKRNNQKGHNSTVGEYFDTEITFEQFKKYVLKESVEEPKVESKEVIPEYVECIQKDAYITEGVIYKVQSEKGYSYNGLRDVYYINDRPYFQTNFKPSTKEAFDAQERKHSEKWSVGSYIVPLQDRLLTRTEPLIKGKPYQITKRSSVPYIMCEKGMKINFHDDDDPETKEGIKWFATKSEAEEFAKTLIKEEVKTPQLDLNEWLNKYKKLNLAVNDLANAIELSNFDEVFLKLEGTNSKEKANILYDLWNPEQPLKQAVHYKQNIYQFTTAYSNVSNNWCVRDDSGGSISNISKPKMLLSIDDEELPMVNIIKTNSIKQLLNND